MPETLKLVRDHVPEIIAADGGRPVTRVLGGEEFRRALLDKLVADSAGLSSSLDGTAPEDFLARLADLMEVLRALADSHGATWAQVERLATSKRVHEGTFLNRITLVDG